MGGRFRSKKLLAAARGRSCVLCGGNDFTTVAAHLPAATYGQTAGTGQKTHDWLVAHLCSECHSLMDSEWRCDSQVRMIALTKTLERLFDDEILIVR